MPPCRQVESSGRKPPQNRILPQISTEVHRRGEEKPGREDDAPGDAGDRHGAVLERLAKGLERRPLELAELVEEEHAVVREARLARTWAGAAADDRGRRRGVVRRAKRRVSDERLSGREDAGDGVDPRHLERLLAREVGQDPREAAGEHRLPGARRAGEKEVLSSGRRDLERTAGALLASDVGKVGRRAAVRHRDLGNRLGLKEATEIRSRVGEVADGDRLDPGERGLGRRLR